MKTKYPIFIPSKARADVKYSPTIFSFKKEDIDFTIVIEPQDEIGYRMAFPHSNFLILPDNDRGIGFSRQYIRDYVKKLGTDFYWQIDDDMTGLFSVENGKTTRIPFLDGILKMEKILDERGGLDIVGLLAPSNTFFAVRENTPESVNCGKCVSFVLTNAKMKCDYDISLSPLEDVTFEIETLMAGKKTISLNNIAFSGKPGGFNTLKMIGGCANDYRTMKHNKSLDLLISKYPEIVTSLDRGSFGKKPSIKWKKILPKI